MDRSSEGAWRSGRARWPISNRDGDLDAVIGDARGAACCMNDGRGRLLPGRLSMRLSVATASGIDDGGRQSWISCKCEPTATWLQRARRRRFRRSAVRLQETGCAGRGVRWTSMRTEISTFAWRRVRRSTLPRLVWEGRGTKLALPVPKLSHPGAALGRDLVAAISTRDGSGSDVVSGRPPRVCT
jgi:hypothetical protein